MIWHKRAWSAGWDAGTGGGLLIAVAALHFLPSLMSYQQVEVTTLFAALILLAFGLGRSVYYEIQGRKLRE